MNLSEHARAISATNLRRIQHHDAGIVLDGYRVADAIERDGIAYSEFCRVVRDMDEVRRYDVDPDHDWNPTVAAAACVARAAGRSADRTCAVVAANIETVDPSL